MLLQLGPPRRLSLLRVSRGRWLSGDDDGRDRPAVCPPGRRLADSSRRADALLRRRLARRAAAGEAQVSNVAGAGDNPYAPPQADREIVPACLFWNPGAELHAQRIVYGN